MFSKSFELFIGAWKNEGKNYLVKCAASQEL